uniref:tryptophan--tRNA ligase n=1 Tax=Candidatus Karelsulcia muelleri TaxID=336810 RepID=UPI0032B1200F
MSRILTGIKSTGIPHIGNVLGVMLPIIDIVNNSLEKVFILIADLHSLTKINNIKNIKDNTYKIAAAWLACGLNIDKAILYRQSDIPQITELFWYLNCFFPYQRLKLSHSFKNMKNYKKNINIGLFTYPILMAADILLFETKIVFVGKDQLQHIEITRKIAKKINNKIKNIFVIPEAKMKKNSMSIPGIDGSKMSKSKNNTINIFSSKKEIKKQIMNIHTNNNNISSYEELNNDIIYNIYKLLANKAEIFNFEKKILFEKEFGYEKAKIELYKYIIFRFSNERKKFKFYLKNKNRISYILKKGAEEAKKIANITMIKIKDAFNFKN